MVKVKIIRTSTLMEDEPPETPAQKKHRQLRNKHKTSRQRKQYPSDDPGHLSRNQKLDGLFPGRETLRKLSYGVFEKKSKVPLCADGHNPNHDKSGKFSDASGDGSWSSGMSDYAARRAKTRKCARGQSARKKTQQRFTRVPCGRAGRVKQKDGKPPTYYRCYDGKKVIPEETLKIPQMDGQVDLDMLISMLGKKQRRIEKLTNHIQSLRKTKCPNQMSVTQLVKALNAVSLAKKGKALEPTTTTPK